jgi:wyosine [tRNA(Phe)-imidazoG37] synthetase (radical SAM superfamily)
MVTNRICFGPVPSRRLGRSLGINNIPPKACSYSCIYCQVGPTKKTEIVPRNFFSPDAIYDEVVTHLERAQKKGESIDYLTFVPDGEPTLDARLGDSIRRLRSVGIPIAIISNASLAWQQRIRETMMEADWVSLKVDAVEGFLWRKINRPHPSLDHKAILKGMLAFSRDFKGTLATESMLIQGLNDNGKAAQELADVLGKLKPDKAYIAIPTRPPTAKKVHTPDESAINRVYQIVHQQVDHLEILSGYEGSSFAYTGDVVKDLLSITAVHPMRKDAVRELLTKAEADWQLVEQLLNNKDLIETVTRWKTLVGLRSLYLMGFSDLHLFNRFITAFVCEKILIKPNAASGSCP